MDFYGFQDFHGIVSVFYGNNQKNIAWDFGSQISSKISAQISASASKISACCRPFKQMHMNGHRK